MYKAVFFVIFFVMAASQVYIDEEVDLDYTINRRLPIDEPIREDLMPQNDEFKGSSVNKFSQHLDIQSILHSLKKIGFGIGITFGSADWSNELISTDGQSMGIGLDMYFRDCTDGDVTTDNLLIQTLRGLFNGSSRIQLSAEYGGFLRDFGLLRRYRVPTRYGHRFRVSRPKMKDFVLGEGSGKGSVAGGGIGVAHGTGHIEAHGSVTTTGAAFGIGLGDAQGLGKGPVINLLTHYLQKLVRIENW